MKRQEFAFLSRLLKGTSGLNLRSDKETLLETRLQRLLKEHQLASVSALCAALLRPDGESLRWRLADVMAVKESYFFRDKRVFACFADQLLPELMKVRANSKHLRIWCAAAATGQEPYSLAMLLDEKRDLLRGWNIEILATDFSEDALIKAQAGIYSQFEVQRGLPVTLLVKYFKRVDTGWELDPAIRSKVSFRHQNLLHNSARHGVFDIVFCRNVMIYFDDETKRAVLERLSRQVAESGYLVLGATETVLGRSQAFAPLPEPCPGVYSLVRPAGEERESASASVARLTHIDGAPLATVTQAPLFALR